MRLLCLSLAALLMLVLSGDSQATHRCRSASSSLSNDTSDPVPTTWVVVGRAGVLADMTTASVGFTIHAAKMEETFDPHTNSFRPVLNESAKPELYAPLLASPTRESPVFVNIVIWQQNLVTGNGLIPLNNFSFSTEKAPTKNEASR